MTAPETRTRPDRSRLRPELRAMLEELDKLPAVDIEKVPPQEERINAVKRLKELWGPAESVDSIEDVEFLSGGMPIPVRIYRPRDSSGVVLFFHGGGWVVGNLETHDGSCRRLANLSNCTVVSVEYRKAPEHPFPAAIQDCDAALDWLLSEGKQFGLAPDQVILCGESAGGNLAAVAAIHARDRGIELKGQVLIYPVIGTGMSTQSYRDFESGFFLGAAAMRWFIRHYVPAGQLAHPDVVPLNTPDLGGLAPTLLMTADHDPLRDEGRAYAAALVKAGNDVTFHEIPGAVHGVWIMNAKTPATAGIIGEAAKWIRDRLR